VTTSPHADPVIRPATNADAAALRGLIVELQTYERRLSPTRRPGAEIANAYLDWLWSRTETDGAILIAACSGAIAGFIACWVRTVDYLAETADSNRSGYISDICVLPAYRGRGIAGHLLRAAEQRLARPGINCLRITSLANNSSACAAYRKSGFVPYEVTFEKRLPAAAAGATAAGP
jgi:ribosomal protein S18 acetylase RimI-like enzyme